MTTTQVHLLTQYPGTFTDIALMKALVLGDLGVNDELQLQHGHNALHIAATHGENTVP
jgi:hypothetical protein